MSILLFYFILFIYLFTYLFICCCSYYYDFCLGVCVTCMFPLVNLFFFFFANDLHFMHALHIHVKNQFPFAIIVYIIIVIITIILFFSTLLAIGREFSEWIRAAWPTPNHWLLWVSHRVSFSLFFVSYTLVTTIERLMPSFIFVIWHHLIMMPRRLKM